MIQLLEPGDEPFRSLAIDYLREDVFLPGLFRVGRGPIFSPRALG